MRIRAALTTAAAATILALTPTLAIAADHLIVTAWGSGQETATATATCPKGYYATGGAVSSYSGRITNDEPSWDGRSWSGTAVAYADGTEVSVSVSAVCTTE